MQEVAEDFENLEKDAAAVLGNADLDSCTYFSGGDCDYMYNLSLNTSIIFCFKDI